MAASRVLDESVAPDQGASRSSGLDAAHRSEPRLQASVIALDAVVCVLLGVMNSAGEHLVQGTGQRGRAIGGEVVRCSRLVQAASEEPPRGLGVLPFSR